MKTTIEVKPQNSDVYVNSEVHYFKIQRGINIEDVIRSIYVFKGMLVSFWKRPSVCGLWIRLNKIANF
jgi:hypothetical protein